MLIVCSDFQQIYDDDVAALAVQARDGQIQQQITNVADSDPNKPACTSDTKIGASPRPGNPPEPSVMWITALVVTLWYASNIGVLLLNKALLTTLKFKQPVFLTLCHMVACVIMSGAVALTGVMPAKPIRSRAHAVNVFVLAVVFCLTIVMGNASLKYIPVSFNQAIGSTTPFFTAIFAFFLMSHRESGLTYAALVPIAMGIVVASGGEPLFHALGFTLCLTATAGRALKSVLQNILLSDPAERLDPMSLLLYMSLFSVVLLAPTAWLMEPAAFSEALALNAKGGGSFGWWLLGNSALAYFVNLLNFYVTKYTSALTLQVLGNAKGVVAAMVSVAVFRNPVTYTGVVGYAITVLGVFLYSESKRYSKKAPVPLPADSQSEDATPLLDDPAASVRNKDKDNNTPRHGDGHFRGLRADGGVHHV